MSDSDSADSLADSDSDEDQEAKKKKEKEKAKEKKAALETDLEEVWIPPAELDVDAALRKVVQRTEVPRTSKKLICGCRSWAFQSRIQIRFLNSPGARPMPIILCSQGLPRQGPNALVAY